MKQEKTAVTVDNTRCDDSSTCGRLECANAEIARLRKMLFDQAWCSGVKDAQSCLDCGYHDTVKCLVDGEHIWEKLKNDQTG